MDKLQALNWLVENITRWPSKGKGIVSYPADWFWGGFTDGEIKLTKVEPTEMYADCHITQQEWLDVEGTVQVIHFDGPEIPVTFYAGADDKSIFGFTNIPDRERGGPIPHVKMTPQEVYRKFDEQTVELLQQRDRECQKPQKIYIAGPMTGYESFNREAFTKRAHMLKAKGYIALNPAILPDGLTQPEYMQICLSMVMCADAIYLLKGWDESKGALAELSLAEKLVLEVIEEE